MKHKRFLENHLTFICQSLLHQIRGHAHACFLLLCTVMLLSGCASLPFDYPRTASTAFLDHERTENGKIIAEMAAEHPGESGFNIIRYPRPAFTSRIALTGMAEKSLDMQYYIWEEDATGHILAERLVRSADRGVKVRALLDDMNLGNGGTIAALMDAHPNIEVRIFNPFAHRASHSLDFFTDLNRVNHRMHNKILVMDNAMAIVGGRNIGNHYFGVDSESNFRDLDIVAVRPIVREVSAAFDTFWNSDTSVPASALVDQPYTEADLRKAMVTMRAQIAENNYPYPLKQDIAEFSSELSSIYEKLIWAPGQIIWDDPDSINDENSTGRIHKAFDNKVETLKKNCSSSRPILLCLIRA